MRWTKVVIAAALVASAAPAMADGGSRDAAQLEGRRAAALAERARLSRGLPARAMAIEDFGQYAYLEDAGDLDGDGKGDVVDVRGNLKYDEVLGVVESMRLEARRGRDGATLWTATVPPASYLHPVFTKVGVDGKPGVLVTAYRDNDTYSDAGGGGAYGTTVYSFNGAGVPLWARDLSGVWGESLPGFAVGDTTVNGMFDAVAGGGSDLLLQTTLMTGGSDPTGTVYDGRTAAGFSVLDGATGAVRPLGAPVQAGWEQPYADVVGDLDKDKLDDFVVDLPNDSGQPALSAFSSADGRQLWTRPKYAGDGFRVVAALPDATGDGASDIAVYELSFGMFAAATSYPVPPQSHVVLLDGASGKQLWRKRGSRAYALGNADGRPGSEIAVGEPLNGSSVGFAVAAFTAKGKQLWSATRKLKAPAERGAYSSSWSAFGDFDSDGVLDIGYAVKSGAGKKMRRDEGWIDGRNGKVTRDPRPDMLGTRAALDGRGADAFLTSDKGGVFTVDAWRGDAPKQLWSTSIRLGGEFSHSEPTSVDGDKCGDLAIALYRDGSDVAVMYSGSTGAPLWVLTRAGDAAGTVAKATVVKQKVYRKGC